MSTPLRAQKWFQNAVATAHFFQDRAGVAKLRDAYKGQTLFLVGGGPSLKQMDLAQLPARGALFMTVNNGHRLFPDVRIPMHAVSDIACYTQFGAAIEQADVGTRFYRGRFRATEPFRAYASGHNVVFVPMRKGGVLKRGFQPHAENGLGNDSSVLVFAAQLGFHMGFQTIAVMGCDLDYSAPNAYAYAMTDADRAHEATAEVAARRRSMINTNAEFAELRRHFEADGRRLINCGVGGKLETLERVPFETLLAQL